MTAVHIHHIMNPSRLSDCVRSYRGSSMLVPADAAAAYRQEEKHNDIALSVLIYE